MKIALVDCNNFFASCERVFNPRLINCPVVVLSNNDGCAVARSEEAKQLGITMGQPFYQWKKLAVQKNIQVFSSNYELYGDLSRRFMVTLADYSPNIEIYSIDEAFIILQENEDEKSMHTLRKTLLQNTGLPVSIGIGQTKTLAKLANLLAKQSKQGVFDISTVPDIDQILDTVTIDKIWGIGPHYSKKLMSYGINTAKKLKQVNDNFIRKQCTVLGLRTVFELRGTPCIELEDIAPKQKNITCSRSFGRSIETLQELKEAVANYTTNACIRLRAQKQIAKKIMVFFWTNPFDKKNPYYANSAVANAAVPTANTNELIRLSWNILEKIYRKGYRYKKAGIILMDLVANDYQQLNLFSPYHEKSAKLMKHLDEINNRFGKNTLYYAALGLKQADWKMMRRMKSPCYTTRWGELLSINCSEQSNLPLPLK